MLQQILLDLESTVESLTMLDEAVQYLSDSLLEELDEAPEGEIDIKRIRLHIWMVSMLTGVACSNADTIQSVFYTLKRQQAKKREG